MSEQATILRTLSVEFDGLATARGHLARMADGNAHAANLPAGLAAQHRQTAANARQESAHFEARAKACLAGARALEENPDSTIPSPDQVRA